MDDFPKILLKLYIYVCIHTHTHTHTHRIVVLNKLWLCIWRGTERKTEHISHCQPHWCSVHNAGVSLRMKFIIDSNPNSRVLIQRFSLVEKQRTWEDTESKRGLPKPLIYRVTVGTTKITPLWGATSEA